MIIYNDNTMTSQYGQNRNRKKLNITTYNDNTMTSQYGQNRNIKTVKYDNPTKI